MQDEDLDDLGLDNTTFVNLGNFNSTNGSYEYLESCAPIKKIELPTIPNAFRNLPPVKVNLQLHDHERI